MTEQLKVTVFEAISLARREIFVAATTLAMHEIVSRISASLPAEIRHWPAGGPVECRSLEFGLDATAARDFISKYAATQSGWRVIAAKEIID